MYFAVFIKKKTYIVLRYLSQIIHSEKMVICCNKNVYTISWVMWFLIQGEPIECCLCWIVSPLCSAAFGNMLWGLLCTCCSPGHGFSLQMVMVSGFSPSHSAAVLSLALQTTCLCWIPSPQLTEHCRGVKEVNQDCCILKKFCISCSILINFLKPITGK